MICPICQNEIKQVRAHFNAKHRGEEVALNRHLWVLQQPLTQGHNTFCLYQESIGGVILLEGSTRRLLSIPTSPQVEETFSKVFRKSFLREETYEPTLDLLLFILVQRQVEQALTAKAWERRMKLWGSDRPKAPKVPKPQFETLPEGFPVYDKEMLDFFQLEVAPKKKGCKQP